MDGGLNNSSYVSDPNQWVDPLGLMGEKDDKGLFWLTDSARKESETEIKKMEQQSRSNPNNTKTQLELMQADGNRGRVVRANTPVVSSTKSERNDFPMPQNSQIRRGSNGGILGALIPGTVSPFARDGETAKLLKNRQGMRNVGTVGAVVAVSPYAIAAGGGVGGAGVKAPIMGALGSAGIDGGFQTFDSIKCRCNAFDGKRTLGVATIGALTAGVGANVAKISGVEYVTAMNLYKNTTNTVGKKIFYGQTAANAAISKPIKEKPSLELKEPKYSR